MNPTLKKIKRQIVDPEISALKTTVLGHVAAVYYTSRRCDVVYFDNDGSEQKIKKIQMPKNGHGVFEQSLMPGDKVELSFRNKSNQNMFISKVYKTIQEREDFNVSKGQSLPGYTGLF